MTNKSKPDHEGDWLDDILYNLESEYLISADRVYKGKDSGAEMARSNLDSSERAKAAILAHQQAAIDAAVLEARIDEIERLGNYKDQFDNRWDLEDAALERVTELRAELARLQGQGKS